MLPISNEQSPNGKNVLLSINEFISDYFAFDENQIENSEINCTLTDLSDNGCLLNESQPRKKIFHVEKEFSNSEKINYCCRFLNCGSRFITEKQYERHVSTHQKKNFSCDFPKCSKCYKSKENLTLHFKNIHLKIKPYKCSHCNSLFSHRNGKLYHERKFHIRYLSYKCNFTGCKIQFFNNSELLIHKKKKHCFNVSL